MKRILKLLNLKLIIESKNWSIEMFVIDFVLKTNPWIYKIKDLNEEKVIGSFYEKLFLLSIS